MMGGIISSFISSFCLHLACEAVLSPRRGIFDVHPYQVAQSSAKQVLGEITQFSQLPKPHLPDILKPVYWRLQSEGSLSFKV